MRELIRSKKIFISLLRIAQPNFLIVKLTLMSPGRHVTQNHQLFRWSSWVTLWATFYFHILCDILGDILFDFLCTHSDCLWRKRGNGIYWKLTMGSQGKWNFSVRFPQWIYWNDQKDEKCILILYSMWYPVFNYSFFFFILASLYCKGSSLYSRCRLDLEIRGNSLQEDK